jgi:hypothetical protein
VSKEFFSTIKSKPCRTLIFTLRDEDGNVVSREEDLEFVCCNFYKKLYQVKEETLEQIEMRAMVLESLPKFFSSELNARLGRPISMEELHPVTKSMVKNKSPSQDGVVVEFYLFGYEVIRVEFSQMIKVAMQVGRFPKGVIKGMVTLLFKAREKENLGHWPSHYPLERGLQDFC